MMVETVALTTVHSVKNHQMMMHLHLKQLKKLKEEDHSDDDGHDHSTTKNSDEEAAGVFGDAVNGDGPNFSAVDNHLDQLMTASILSLSPCQTSKEPQ